MTEPTPPASAKSARPAWVLPVVAGLVVIVFGLTAVVIWALRPKAAAPSPATTTSATTSVSGNLTTSVGPLWEVGTTCYSPDYADIAVGAQVTITDGTGVVVALGALHAGIVKDNTALDGAKICVFDFEVAGVPTGRGIYAVEVAHRGKVNVAEADLAKDVHLTLG